MFTVNEDILLAAFHAMNDEPVRNLETHKRWAFTDAHFRDIEHYFPNLNFVGGAVFWHNEPYPLHVDVWDTRNKSQLLIPMKMEAEDQNFILFDQVYEGSMTWKNDADKQVKKAKYDDAPKSTTGLRPYDTEGVEWLTYRPIDPELGKLLPEPDDFYYGLSGKVYSWKPGIGLAFESKTLHATGNMDDKYFKTGMALWFADPIEDVLKCVGDTK